VKCLYNEEKRILVIERIHSNEHTKRTNQPVTGINGQFTLEIAFTIQTYHFPMAPRERKTKDLKSALECPLGFFVKKEISTYC
jgi:hypothetical protein